ncbi:signal transduction histidine kinase [Krasilnikovia cinnamomea]|uniref:histidine kinase n=1 Tax=Krasilnikovia cinnamomea TaxID=349313 RepID=A0A4Q7ZN44_9ACTN|nr:HAMP domain-containing sensor histidine kinase [Krasilnikovia cinnamomea]RZU51785.1 signal transduction histidine kinase [Krasilnikovia cinnamomea]
MRARTVRRRLLVVCLVVALVVMVVDRYSATFTYWVTFAQVCSLWEEHPRPYETCDMVNEYLPIQSPLAFALLAVVLWAGSRWVTRWVLGPARDLVPGITQIGPQNLGYRIGAGRPSHDEFAPVVRALDDMMERIAGGYEAQRRFSANASHELRTPLAVQRALIEVGLAQEPTADQLSLLSRQMLQANERNERLIEGLLVLSEADQGLAAKLPQRLDIIARQVVDAQREASVAVSLTCDLSPRTVDGERVLLERLVTNLVQNAVKYNRPGGTVHVTVGGDPALTVVNTGPPVPADAVPRLFEPFQRLADRIDHSGGSGLGLAIARSITRAHGGTIVAEPAGSPEHGGLRVTVRMPVSHDEAVPPARSRTGKVR